VTGQRPLLLRALQGPRPQADPFKRHHATRGRSAGSSRHQGPRQPRALQLLQRLRYVTPDHRLSSPTEGHVENNHTNRRFVGESRHHATGQAQNATAAHVAPESTIRVAGLTPCTESSSTCRAWLKPRRLRGRWCPTSSASRDADGKEADAWLTVGEGEVVAVHTPKAMIKDALPRPPPLVRSVRAGRTAAYLRSSRNNRFEMVRPD